MYQVPPVPAAGPPTFDASQRPVPPSGWVQPAQGTLITPWSIQTQQPPPLPAPTVTALQEGSWAAEIPAPPLQQPPLTEESLAVGEFAVDGGGESCRVIIWDSPRATDNSPVVAYLPGSNGWQHPNQPGTWVPPVPCRMVVFELGGKSKSQGKNSNLP